MACTLADLAARLGAELVGDPDLVVDRPAGLSDAGEGSVAFLANPKYAPRLAETRATAVIVHQTVEAAPCALLKVENPDLAFARACVALCPPLPAPPAGVHPAAFVAPDAHIGVDASVGAFAVVGAGAVIGDGTVLHPHAVVGAEAVVGAHCELHPHSVLYPRTRLGDRVAVHAGAVVGSDGFGYAWNGRELEKIPQVGIVAVADDVEIGANTAVDRARFGRTEIGPGTKIDNLVQIAHNVKIGAHCGIASQVGIAGSTTIGNGVRMAGQAGVVGHIKIGDGAVLSAKTGIMNDVPAGEQFTGIPARRHREMLEQWALTESLGKMRKRLRDLEKRLAELEKHAASDDE